jgi:hypothetical protein
MEDREEQDVIPEMAQGEKENLNNAYDDDNDEDIETLLDDSSQHEDEKKK